MTISLYVPNTVYVISKAKTNIIESLNLVQVLAKKFGAAMVTLEHRYYGKSNPFDSLTTENLKFLSSKQALYDLATFRQFYQVCSMLWLFGLQDKFFDIIEYSRDYKICVFT